MYGNASRSRGFTLVEMAVVLVIIGLLGGGILVGRSLLRQSQINSTMVDAQKYIDAVRIFQQKYSALPGDMSTATNFWGAAGGTAGTNYTTDCYASGTLMSPATCNGNGDDHIWQFGSGDGTYASEQYLFWKHLADAGLIQAKFSGVQGSAGFSDHVVGINCPASKMKGVGFGIIYIGTMSGDVSVGLFDGSYGHTFGLGGYFANALPLTPMLTALEAQVFDTKYDDGTPAYGSVRSFKLGSPLDPVCATTAVSSTAAYNVTVPGLLCSFGIITGF